MSLVTATQGRYRGRFAPSPTGPLHLGSLVAAVGSYLQARRSGGEWFLRIEDLDQERNQPGAADAILHCLEQHGLYWDGAITYQHRRLDSYQHALTELTQLGQVFYCSCSRKELNQQGARIYPGTCRHRITSAPGIPLALRLRVGTPVIAFRDAIQGDYRQSLASEVGDFVIRRADGFIAYQLAVVVDDAAQGITEVVRGADLLENTPRQIYLQRLLGLPTPDYRHLPIVTDRYGEKLSKQTGAAALNLNAVVGNLWTALAILGQQPPSELVQAGLPELWQWALIAWDPKRIPRKCNEPPECRRDA